MSHLKKLFKKFNFLNPSRWVWFDSESEPISSEPEEPQQEEISFEEFMENLNFLQSTRDRCRATKEEGGKLIEKQVCSLSETPEELIRYRKFVDELGEKFLSTLYGETAKYQAKDFFTRLEMLQEVTDFKKITESFRKAESYVVNPLQGKESAHILFTYPDGQTERVELELSQGEEGDALAKGIMASREGAEQRELKAINNESEEEVSDELAKSISKSSKRGEEARKQFFQKAVDGAKTRETRDDVYDALLDLKENKKISAEFPDDLLHELSQGPLFEFNILLAEAGDDFSHITDEQKMRVSSAIAELDSIIANYYGIEAENLSEYLFHNDQQKYQDLSAIRNLFGIM